MELRPEEITKIIREQIKNYENRLETSETGSIILVGDGIARATEVEIARAAGVNPTVAAAVRKAVLAVTHKSPDGNT